MADACCDGERDTSEKEIDLKIRLDADGKFLGLKVNGEDVTLDKGEVLEVSCDVQSIDSSQGEMHETHQLARNKIFSLIRNAAISVFVVVTAQFMIEHWFGPDDIDFYEHYGLWIFYLDISVVALISTLSYVRSYAYADSGHVVGMLIGMTVGMQVGTMVGGVLGATNGFFVGSMVGIISGAIYGVAIAWCCGSVAVLHGLMGGAMGGPMGAMVVGMMLPDNVLIFMPFFTGINVLILMCFTYIFYRECVVNGQCPTRKVLGLPTLVVTSVLTTSTLSAIVLFGPRGPMAMPGPEIMNSTKTGAGNPFTTGSGATKSGNRVPEMGCGAMMTPK